MGCDPGYSGGLAVMSSSGKILHYCKMPIRVFKEGPKKKRVINVCQLSGLIAKYEPAHFFIEKAQVMPKNGAVGMFNYGVGYGMILGLCQALEQVFGTHQIPPSVWHKFMCDPGDAPAKQRALVAFHRLWPELVEQNVTHDGIVDSLLICEYGRRSLNLQ